jgi:hypothetical protein
MSDPREPSEPESTENTPATPAEPTPAEPTPAAAPPSPNAPSAPPFPGGAPAPSEPPAAPSAPPAPPAPSFAPPTPPLPSASSSLPPIQTPPTPPSAPSAPTVPSAPSYGPPSTGAPSSAPSYGAPPVYGSPASNSSPSAPPPAYGSPYGSNPSSAGTPPSGQLPYTTPYAPGQIPPRGKGGWMGIVSIVLGGLALLASAVPVLDYVTVFGAIAGLVFGLIALFKKFGSRGLALTGTIVSGVAFIVSVIFIIIYTLAFVGFGNAVDDYEYTDTPSTSSPLDDEPTESNSPDDESSAAPGDPTAVPGDPTPSAGATVCTDGTAIALGKAGILTYDGENQAEITVNDVQLNATDAILSENSLNETPPSGYQYALISLTVKQLGTEDFPAGGTRGIFKGVAEDIASPADYAVLPQPELLFAPDLTPGASVTGNITVFVPTSGADAGSVLVDNYFTDNVCELKVG